MRYDMCTGTWCGMVSQRLPIHCDTWGIVRSKIYKITVNGTTISVSIVI